MAVIEESADNAHLRKLMEVQSDMSVVATKSQRDSKAVLAKSAREIFAADEGTRPYFVELDEEVVQFLCTGNRVCREIRGSWTRGVA